MRVRSLSTLGAVLISLCGSAAAWSTSRSLTELCTVSGDTTNANLLSRGIVVTGYPGNNLSQVELAYVANTGHASTYAITLTARRGSFGGPIIGTPQTATVQVGDIAGGSYTFVFFDFGAAPVTANTDNIYFIHTYEDLNGTGGVLYFNNGGGSCPGIFQTSDTNPPNGDGVIRNSVAILIDEVDLSSACIASDTTMCVDNNPGDQRFRVTVSFHTSQGGGFSGNGQEIPLARLGVIHGGLFWFFGPDNPEMLFKMVNGCALNSHFWVFLSAGTNVAFTVTVFDTANGHTATYHNPDLNPAPPVQDTSALPCP